MIDHDKIINNGAKELIRSYIINAGDLELMPSDDIGARGYTTIRRAVISAIHEDAGELGARERDLAEDTAASIYEVAKMVADRKWRAVLDLLDLV